MAKQTEIGYEPTKEWQDYQTGGTRIDAADLNNMEQGIADACAAVDELRTRRLPTYVVLEGGDTATQDAYAEPILGPCLILDLATRTTYYESGGDEEGHRKAITSGADIDAIRDSLSQCVTRSSRTKAATLSCDPAYDQRVMVTVDGTAGDSYILIVSDGYIGLYDSTLSTWVWRKRMSGVE